MRYIEKESDGEKKRQNKIQVNRKRMRKKEKLEGRGNNQRDIKRERETERDRETNSVREMEVEKEREVKKERGIE